MIHEYAVDPAFLLELVDKQDLASSFCRALTIGSACITAGYPEDVGAKARELALIQQESAIDPRHKAKWQERVKQVTELAAECTRTTTKRCNAIPWAQSFTDEHGRFPFEGILSTREPDSGALPHRNFDWLRRRDCHLFACPGSRLVHRSAQNLNDALTPLLRNASMITFVDPYFFVEDRFRQTYKLYFDTIAQANHVRAEAERTITIVCAVDTGKNSCPADEFRNGCEGSLPALLPNGLKLMIYRIRNLPSAQEIHNRYILTDIGGVMFGHGTDSSVNASYDNISLLDPISLTHWKNAYTPNSSAFDWSEPPVFITPQ